MNNSNALDTLKAKLVEIHHIQDTAALLSWDQETYMPRGGGSARAEQIATLQTLAHNLLVSPEIKQLLNQWIDPATEKLRETSPPLDEASKALLRETWRDFRRAEKLPSQFVHQLERECSLAQQVWAQARENNAFSQFLPNLRTIVSLKQEEAQYLGYTESSYDALLDTYEPGATVAQLKPLFATLREGLLAILKRIESSPVTPNDSLLFQTYDHASQIELGKLVLSKMGYDFDKGRLDLSAHPFTTSFHPTDVRVTTRVSETDLPSCLFSCIHEGGHGLYDQGLPSDWYGTPLAEPISLGMHESQSRLWENCVGRSRPFWEHFFPIFQQKFPEQLGRTTLNEFYTAINAVKPSLIRVEADEVTYNLHIMVRFEIELELMAGSLDPKELPDLWNKKMTEYLGVTPQQDAEGVLQDVHWSLGAIGYFPTYTLGNLYSALFFEQACTDIPDLQRNIAAGELTILKNWLNDKIHRWGRHYASKELLSHVTGKTLTAEPFLQYLERKVEEVYSL